MSWAAVCDEAQLYLEPMNALCPRYVSEMRGIAKGAGVTLIDIIALNVRTEITFGLFTLDTPAPPLDGCTSLAYRQPYASTSSTTYLAQNWDWQREQRPNIVVCRIEQPGLPRIAMVTEAGIIGKIGLNSAGVGVCMNAIRARGVTRTKLPVHLAMRAVLESPSRGEAISRLRETGVAGSVHLLIADAEGASGTECTVTGIREIPLDEEGKVVHGNHLLLEHGVDEPIWLADSPLRTRRMDGLLREKLSEVPELGFEGLYEVFKDEEGYPAGINRCQVLGCETETLFTIMMDLGAKKAVVTFGRPTRLTDGAVHLDLA